VLEPSLPGGAVKTARKGCGEYVVTVRGVAAHAGVDPASGASAIHELAHQIGRIQQIQDLARGISVNVGQISGGTRPNVVAEEARAIVDVRAPTAADASRIDEALRALAPVNPRTTISVAGGIDRPPLERRDGVVRLYGTACGVATQLGITLAEGATGGGSDGNFTAALGVSTLDGLGAVGDGAHERWLRAHAPGGAQRRRSWPVTAVICAYGRRVAPGPLGAAVNRARSPRVP
jgi:glutamate carboxypeptidase